jgi:hypothetical protein
MEPQRKYLSYMLRLWRNDTARPWHASLQDPHSDEPAYFATPEALYAFLEDQMKVSEQKDLGEPYS